VPVEVVREPGGKTVKKILEHFGFVPNFLDEMKKFRFCFKKFWNTSKRFDFVSKFLDYMEKFRFCFKNSRTHQNNFFFSKF
jgi:hypothetical protein